MNIVRHVLDIADDKDVDICIKENPYCWDKVNDETYDIVISMNSFQHTEYFWCTLKEIHRVLKKDGFFVMIAPSNRYDGKFPKAYWAFNEDGLRAMAEWAGLKVIDASVAGIPTLNADPIWDNPLDDAMLIATKKDIEDQDIDYPKLIFRRRDNSEKELLRKWLEVLTENGDALADYLISMGYEECYIFGAGIYGNILSKELASKMHIINILDNYKTGKLNDIEIVLPEMVNDKSKPVIISAYGEFDFINNIETELRDKGLNNIITIAALINAIA